jgi:hypothetical protein
MKLRAATLLAAVCLIIGLVFNVTAAVSMQIGIFGWFASALINLIGVLFQAIPLIIFFFALLKELDQKEPLLIGGAPQPPTPSRETISSPGVLVSPTAPTSSNIYEMLQQLKTLLDDGVLSTEEFETEKKKLLEFR